MRSRFTSSPESSPMTAPRNITSTRSHSKHEFVELRRHQHDADARAGDLVDDLADLFLRADVDADRRLVHDEHFRPRLQPFCEQNLLLIASGKLARQRQRAGRVYAQTLDVSLRRALHLREIQRAANAAKARQDRKADILDEREIRARMPSPSRSLVRSAIPLSSEAAGSLPRTGFPSIEDPAGSLRGPTPRTAPLRAREDRSRRGP